MQSELQCLLSRKNTCTHTGRIRPPVLKFSQASPLFCRGKHQGAQSEEQTNNKLTHSPVTLCLDCKHKRASVCVCVYTQHYSKLQSRERERKPSCGAAPGVQEWQLADFIPLTFPRFAASKCQLCHFSILGSSEMLRRQWIGSESVQEVATVKCAVMLSLFDVICAVYFTVFVHCMHESGT